MRTSVYNVNPASQSLLDSGDLAAHLRLDSYTETQDYLTGVLDGFIDSATDYVEGATGQKYVLATVQHVIDAFPHRREIFLPLPPVKSVESVTYIAADGTTATLDPAIYIADTISMPARIVLKAGQFWPATAHQPSAVTFNFTSGYDDPSDVSPSILQCVKLLAAHWYSNREATSAGATNEVPLAVSSIIAMNRFIGAV